MRIVKRTGVVALILGIGMGVFFDSVRAQDYQEYPLEARVWLDRGHEPVLQRGETARLYYRVSEDAFVAIFHIDTNGTTRIVFPSSPQENHYARGGRDYRVLFPGSSYWLVNDDPGMGYFFIVASPEPFDFRELRYSHYNGGWDLSYVGRQVYRDPYLAMDDYVAALIPDWEYVPYTLDFTSYNVDQRYDYPRFMCYDCHGFRPYGVWNPYHYSCSTFRVVIYNDPYYYPVTRYRGTRVVYVQPRRGVAHFSFKERAAGEPGTPQIVVRNSPATPQPGVGGTAARRAQPRAGGTSGGVSPSPQAGRATGTTWGGTPGVSGTTTRRPSNGSVAPGGQAGQRGTTGTAQPRPSTPGRSTALPPANDRRPVLERRPTTGSSGTRPSTSPSTRPTTTRPSSRVKRSGGGGVSVPSGSRSIRGGTTSGSSRSTVGRSTSGTQSRPTVSRGSTTSRPTVRSGGTTRSTAPRATVRSGGGSRSTPSRPTASRSGGTQRTAPARAARKPAKKRPGGGGGE